MMRFLRTARWLSFTSCILVISLVASTKTDAAEDFTAPHNAAAPTNGFYSSQADNGFRVDNRLFLSNQKEPHSQSTTIFQNNAVYDYLDQPKEVLVYDKNDDRFVLLNTTRRICAEIKRQQVLQFAEQMRQRTVEHSDPYIKFLGNPSFTKEFDHETSVLTLTSPWITYRVKAVPGPTPGSAERYREFIDWNARLAPMLNAAARPPFVRLWLNAALVERGMVPSEIQRVTITPKQGIWSKRTLIRSEHQWINRLETADLVRVAQTRQFMTIFNPVSLEQYIKLVASDE